jgi:energy-coupling factor transporter transmembrane protein EcfT
MDKKKVKNFVYKYTDFNTLRGIGGGWVEQLKGYFPFGAWVASASVYQIALWALKIDWIPYWLIIIFLAIKFYLMIFINWIIAKVGIKMGIYEAQQQYGAKQQKLSPYEREHRETIKNIAKAVNAKSEYTDL